jgi:hypothetical protein
MKKTDQKGYKNPDSYSEHFKKVVKNENFHGPALFSSGLLMFITAFSSALYVSDMTPVPEGDRDAYTGVFNQTQNYSLLGDGSLLFKNDEGYALYEQRGQRFILEEDRGRAIEKIESRLSQLENYSFHIDDPFKEVTLPVEQCSYISKPFELNGNIERYESPDYNRNCDSVISPVAQADEVLEQEAEIWREALAFLSVEGSHYGIDPDDLTEAQVESNWERFAEINGSVAGGFGAFWLLIGAGAAGVSRRKSIKSKKTTPRP